MTRAALALFVGIVILLCSPGVGLAGFWRQEAPMSLGRSSSLKRAAKTGSEPRAKTLARPSVRGEAARVVDALESLYPRDAWGLLRNVRSSTGDCESARFADAVTVALWPSSGPQIHGIEVKASRADWIREMRRPEKSAPISRFCSAWFLAVPAPYGRIVLSTSLELPEGWGLIEVEGRRASVIVEAVEREAEEPSGGFWRSLLRAGLVAAQREADPDHGAPMIPITRPTLSRDHVGLACGHKAPRPRSKVLPLRVPCFPCADGQPTDPEVVEAAIADAGPEELRKLGEQIARRAPRPVEVA